MKNVFCGVLFLLLSSSVGVAASSENGGPKMSADEFLDSQGKNAVTMRLLSQEDGGFLPLATYQVDGHAYVYISNWLQCTFGGYPERQEMEMLLNESSVSLLDKSGPLAVLHCPSKDIIVRVEKELYQIMLLAYASPDKGGSGVERDGKVFSVTVSSWPLLNSPGYDGTLFDAAYVVVTNETDGIQVTHNGAEVFVQMSPEKLFELTELTERDLRCETEMVSLMIPLNREGYFPGETGNAYSSVLFGRLLAGKRVPPGIMGQVKIGFCHKGLYEVLVPVFPSNRDGSS